MAYHNQDKLRRAHIHAKSIGKEGDAEAIHARYIELGGKFTPEDSSDIETVEEQSLEKPKRVRRAKTEDED